MKRLVLVLSLISLYYFTYGQNYVELDLSSKSGDKTIGLTTPGVKLINMSLQNKYRVRVTVQQEKGSSSQFGDEAGADSCNEAHPKIVKLITSLQAEKDEVKVAEWITLINDSLSDKSLGKCKDDLQKAAAKVIEKTMKEYSFESLTANFSLKKNQNIIVTVDAVDDKGNNLDKHWEFMLRTPRSVSYITHFGFTFSPNIIKEPSQYFSKAAGKSISSPDVDSFTIKRRNNNGTDFWKDLSITANFLMPINLNRKQEELNNFNLAWCAGFGVSGDARFTVFTGPSMLVSDWAALTLGFGASYAYKLKGEYEEGQGLLQSLDFDQLHERGIRPTVLLSFSFRFSREQLGKAIEKIGGK
ncbi:hypothetical protein SAMN05660461_1381 [Chitinophaga ginsengisegetis]|uniref:Uncharacterized protein n=1 Tax=Chitinophaga ginsengisegetis TaxID=393003 RepID=A0A1T5NF29_9BACT|nr:hypothetical protein [Chitinophaga ginsengisegetis]SKC99140.1 hypothetical protein SAMN05660461_1381 [Chitinophaga ginsengisegetis]